MRRVVWTTIATLTAASAIAACGSSPSNGALSDQSTGTFPAAVSATFPARQRLAEAANLVIKVTNTGRRTMPNVAVTLINPESGPGAQALGTLLAAPASGQAILAGRSRPVWIIDRTPGPCRYSCSHGGPGAGASAYTDTWALGSLAPGDSRTFAWHVTALQPGSYTVGYRVAAGLVGKASVTGSATQGKLKVVISSSPRRAYVNSAGNVVYGR